MCVSGASVCRVQVCVGCKCVSGASVCRVQVCVGCKCVLGASVCRIHVCVGYMCVSDTSVCQGKVCVGDKSSRGHVSLNRLSSIGKIHLADKSRVFFVKLQRSPTRIL
jgi:hypothetical protein